LFSDISGGGYNYFDPYNPKEMPYDSKSVRKTIMRKEDLKDLRRETFPEEGYGNPTMKKASFFIEPIENDLYVRSTETGYRGAHPKLMHDFRGRIVKHPEVRKRALNFVHDLKLIGKEAGIEAGIEARKSLEHKVTSAVTIGSLATLILFISSNITGNAIADLTVKTSSSIGIVLLAIALISGFFWLRNRKNK